MASNYRAAAPATHKRPFRASRIHMPRRGSTRMFSALALVLASPWSLAVVLLAWVALHSPCDAAPCLAARFAFHGSLSALSSHVVVVVVVVIVVVGVVSVVSKLMAPRSRSHSSSVPLRLPCSPPGLCICRLQLLVWCARADPRFKAQIATPQTARLSLPSPQMTTRPCLEKESLAAVAHAAGSWLLLPVLLYCHQGHLFPTRACTVPSPTATSLILSLYSSPSPSLSASPTLHPLFLSFFLLPPPPLSFFQHRLPWCCGLQQTCCVFLSDSRFGLVQPIPTASCTRSLSANPICPPRTPPPTPPPLALSQILSLSLSLFFFFLCQRILARRLTPRHHGGCEDLTAVGGTTSQGVVGWMCLVKGETTAVRPGVVVWPGRSRARKGCGRSRRMAD